MKCLECDSEMEVIEVRDDGCRLFGCLKCGFMIGEETKEWFDKMFPLSL